MGSHWPLVGRVALVLGLGGCATIPTTADVTTAPLVTRAPPASPTKIFLVAGGSDSANFAQEVIDQRDLWRAAGFGDDEIACYWAPPTPAAARADRWQYARLIEQLGDCRPAHPRQLHRDLEAAAAGNPPFVYLYITSHGQPSLLRHAETGGSPQLQAIAATATTCERATLDQPTVSLDATGPGSPALPDVLTGLRAGLGQADLMMTPTSLQQALGQFASDVPKIVVLQACFSGGFIDPDGRPETRDGLASLANTVVLTAAARDRPSFGCQVGASVTEFGGAFNRALALQPDLSDPQAVDWSRVYDRAVAAVERRERKLRLRASHPRHLRTGPTPAPAITAGKCAAERDAR